ncbi:MULTISPECIES: RHS repeat-associated core domain-containing protein [unclassified Treponema]|uniref:RHS repeat-associated core domain-containing protein n=2 Tax=Treponema TaxID=157 RepID=UPI0020A3DE32|nr:MULTISPECIES: RHS repeat-associated core domain-containing protein [unclassified Treponema]
MKPKLYLYSQPNYLIFRTAIEREQKQFIKIAFAVHLSAVISAERYRSDSGALKSAVLTLVYFYIIMIVHKCQQSAKRKLLLNKNNLSEVFPLTVGSGKTMPFGNRWSRYKEPSKNKAEAYRVYVEHLFLRSDAGDARIFSKDEDVYGIDYGFGLDAPKETEQSNPQDLFAYRRNYTWNERNLLTKSSDRNYTVHYRYGEDGQRALKYTDEGRSETLYFNNFFTIHIPTQDQNNPQGLRVHKHIFVGNSRLVTAMTHTDNHGDNEEQKAKRYYYHSDHLGSAQFVTDWNGRQYEHIEYTPYGELWIEETAPGIDKLPFRFTGKELDEETGLYYYGARYLDPKYSRWLSGDPALGDYMAGSSVGEGGIYNTVNFNVYHYGGNNPIKYVDPTGCDDLYYDENGNYLTTANSETSNIYMTRDQVNTLVGTQSDFEKMTAALYGEATNDLDEMQAIGDVIMNRAEYANTSANTEIEKNGQVNGYNASSRKTVTDNRLLNSDSKLNNARNAAMSTILGTTRGKSNGAYYWDGADIQTNEHKTEWGIHYTNQNHDIYGTGDSTVGPFQEHWYPSGANRGTPWNHKLDSTAAYGGTIFWKLSPHYQNVTGSRSYQ